MTNTSLLTTDQASTLLRSPVMMLETLKVAYRFALDRSSLEGAERIGENRVSVAEQRELGRRLAIYWMMEEGVTTPHEITTQTHL